MPLTEHVSFKATLQKGNRIQVPRLIRWRFKMEPTQILKVTVETLELGSSSESFYARMGRDGRITIPKLVLRLLDEDENLEGQVFEVDIEPA